MDVMLVKHNIKSETIGCLTYSKYLDLDEKILVSESIISEPCEHMITLIPTTNYTWILGYNYEGESKGCFYYIGMTEKVKRLTLDGYTNYIFITFSDEKFYIKNGRKGLCPAVLYNEIIKFIPKEGSCEEKIIKELKQSTDMEEHSKMIKIFLENERDVLKFPKYIHIIQNMLKEYLGKISVIQLAEMTGYSVRQVNRIFTNFFGIGPKKYGKILRFQKVLKEIVSNPWRENSEFLQNMGYSDQPHFQREFKSFMEETPKQFIHAIFSDEKNEISGV